MIKKLFLLALITIAVWPGYAPATENIQKIKLPGAISPELSYLLDFTGSASGNSFEPQRIRNVIDFVASEKNRAALYHDDGKFDATSAYYEFDIHKKLGDILKLVYNSKIPAFALMPSSLRLCYWSEIEGRKNRPLPELWSLLPKLGPPVIIRGVQHLENTPDLFSGAYFAYDLDSVLILCKFRGHNALIAISRQKDISDVGRKGLILGSDRNWDYLYSKQAGLTKSGLGWIRPYMYDSYSISIYYETDTDTPKVRCAIFKWLRAGWANINMVKPKHLYRGMQRFGDVFQEIIESPALPAPGELVVEFAGLNLLSIEELRTRVKAYFDNLMEFYRNEKKLSRRCFATIFNNDFVNQMSRKELHSVVVLEHLKKIMGR